MGGMLESEKPAKANCLCIRSQDLRISCQLHRSRLAPVSFTFESTVALGEVDGDGFSSLQRAQRR
jgi:hypothetical protein